MFCILFVLLAASLQSGVNGDASGIEWLVPSSPRGTAAPSPGCGFKVLDPSNCMTSAAWHQISVPEPPLKGVTKRSYYIDVPDNVSCISVVDGLGQPAAVLFSFHGQYGTADNEYSRWTAMSGLNALARRNGFIQVLPQGINDHVEGTEFNNGVANMGTGWNCGSGGDEDVCFVRDAESRNSSSGAGVVTQYSCYQSCVDLSKCGRCNWATCHDDVAFVQAILADVADRYCIDMSRVYVAGESNGGMFVHHLAEKMPETFAAFVPVFGTPLRGYMPGAHGNAAQIWNGLRDSALLAIHDRGDTCIPVNGGMASDKYMSWYYEPFTTVLQSWANIHSCAEQATPLQHPHIPVEPGPDNFQCVEHVRCATGKRIIGCLYGTPGKHGDVPADFALGKMTFWLFSQSRRAVGGRSAATSSNNAVFASEGWLAFAMIAALVLGGYGLLVVCRCLRPECTGHDKDYESGTESREASDGAELTG